MKSALKYNALYRSTVIIWMVLKFILQIYLFHARYNVWDERTNAKWDKLLVKLAKEYRKKAIDLGGVLVKVGQFFSTRADFMPDVFIQELSGLVDRVPPMSEAYAKALMEREWGTRLDQHLSYFEPHSVASASIGEVYKATLKDGSNVAIKVQRYKIEKIFHKDFTALRIVFWILSVFTSFGKKADLKALYRELVIVMNRELNYQKELSYAKYFQERLKDNDAVHVPIYYESLCTEKVLVMEWIGGAKITDLAFFYNHHIDVQKVAKTLFDVYLDQFINSGYFHADPHGGNILVQENGMISIIDFGMVGEVRKQDTNYFKQLIRSIVVDDYDKVIETLDEMNFLLPNANRKKLKKMIKQTIELYQNGSFSNMDEHTMEQIKDDISIFIKDQPIQLPAEYAYLGRAMSIVVGILFELYPDVDIQKWAKPKIKQWFGGFVEGIYVQTAVDMAKPLLSFPKAMLHFLESGEKDRQWDKEKQKKQLKHQFFVVLELITFVMVLCSAGLIIYGVHISLQPLTISGIIAIGLFIIMINIILFIHYRMIRSSM
ncbi:ABC1 kinase family protein [Virgibacillus halotolerans]|uniref:ABC1 kinase family protein n=1 Tax=Virgibacillus halotolerans TaxID=1071053 RepID=UPI001EF80629|nr:AarF/UbiB family protein [Virgibacillus halotolerans]